MRVIFVALVSALAAIGCEKDSPAPPTPVPTGASQSASSGQSSASQSGAKPGSAKAAPSSADQPTVEVELAEPVEGHGEPMDDVDDEVPGVGDKSGAADEPGVHTPEGPEDDAVE